MKFFSRVCIGASILTGSAAILCGQTAGAPASVPAAGVSSPTAVSSASATGQTGNPVNAVQPGPVQPGPAATGQIQSSPGPTVLNLARAGQPSTLAANPGVRELLDFRPSDVKFSVPQLMDILRDRRHEGWVLAAYPDPKTGRPLIGAGFSLDLPEREHPQTDPLNPHPFVEPSSAQLWAAAGLDPARLTSVLEIFDEQRSDWTTRQFRRKLAALAPEITDTQADALLRVAAIQAIENAKAYCRNFESMTAAQQMAMSQLVYQMGVNLAEFSQFLGLVNDGSEGSGDREHWRTVQQSLIQSQWARLYRTRAVAVIAMLDPTYADEPAAAEHRIAATLRPAVVHRQRGRRPAGLEVASYRRGVHPAHNRSKRSAKRA